jgi:hypothetical protein
MKEIIAKIDWSIVLLIGYGVLSDIIGESKKTESGSVPGFLLLCLKSVVKNLTQPKALKK